MTLIVEVSFCLLHPVSSGSEHDAKITVSRKYWHCLKEDAEPVHLTCDTDEQGEFMMWDLMFDGCNFGAQTDCGERQVCDDCNEECWPHGGGGDDSLDCDHDMGQ